MAYVQTYVVLFPIYMDAGMELARGRWVRDMHLAWISDDSVDRRPIQPMSRMEQVVCSM
jgi:hypothetical protein